MTRVLALCSPADVSGSVRQFDLALPSLRDRFDVVRHTTPTDVTLLIASLRPDLIHTLGSDAFRAVRRESVAAFARRQGFPKWLAAGATGVEPMLGFAPGLTATFAQSEHDRDWAARLSPPPMQFSGPLGVQCAPHPLVADPGTALGESGTPHILACGGFDDVANLRHVVWAFDALHYAHPSLELVLLGDGPGRGRVAEYARALRLSESQVRCVGFRHDLAPFSARATQVWSTHTRGGAKFLLEAMAAGVPAVAYRTPDTERLGAGRLVPAGRPVEVARAAHSLLTNAAEAAALAAAGEAAAGRHPVANLAEAVAGVYHSLTSSVFPRSE